MLPNKKSFVATKAYLAVEPGPKFFAHYYEYKSSDFLETIRIIEYNKIREMER